jgi:hypothetical protein
MQVRTREISNLTSKKEGGDVRDWVTILAVDCWLTMASAEQCWGTVKGLAVVTYRTATQQIVTVTTGYT